MFIYLNIYKYKNMISVSMITKKESFQKNLIIWVDKGTEFAGEFKKSCKAEGIQI